MKPIFLILALFSLAVAGANVFVERDGDNALEDIFGLEIRQKKPCTTKELNNNIKGAIVTHIKLNRTLAGIPNDGPIGNDQLAELSNEFNTIVGYLNGAIKSAKCHKKLTKAECQRIVHILSANFLPVVFQVLDDIVAHKVAFQNAGVLSIICDNVKKACALIQQLFKALEAIAVPACKKQLIGLAGKFADKCKATLAALGCK